MNRTHTWRSWAAFGIVASLCTGTAARASAYNVYYRVDPSAPWVFYTGTGNIVTANATLADLQASGYAAQIVPGGEGNYFSGSSLSSNSVINNRVGNFGYPYGSYGGGYGARSWGSTGSGYSYGGGAAYGGGGFRNADNWHHHSHAANTHAGARGGARARAVHPTTHPHARQAAHHGRRSAGRGVHHAAHHGGHHGHAHSHSHGGHHGRR